MTRISESNKRIAKNTLMLYFRMFITMAISLYTSRIVLNALGVNDFGIYNIVGGIVACFAFINSALTSSSTRYISVVIAIGDFCERKKVFSATFILHLVCALIIFLILETIGLWFVNNYLVIPNDRIFAANIIYQFSIFTSVVTIITVPYSATIVANEKMEVFAYLAVVDVVLKLILSISIFYYSKDKLILYSFLMMLSSGLIAVLNIIYCYKKFAECHKLFFKIETTTMRSMSKYIGWSMYSNLAHISYLQGINILLNLFFGPAVNAARALAVNVQSAVMGFTNNFQMALNPQIIKNYADGSTEVLLKLVYRSVRFSFYLLSVLIIPILLSVDVLLKSWLGIVPTYTCVFCRLILIASFVNAFSNPLMTLIQANGKLKINSLYTGNCLLLILPVSYLFLKLGYEPPIVFVINVFFYILAFIIRLYIVKGFMDFAVKNFVWVCLVKPFGVILLPLILSITFNSIVPRTLLAMIIYDMAVFLLVLIFIYLFGLENGEKDFLKNKVICYLHRKWEK
ncbi:lipopolysaccharide biosynthesis protein [Bacteroides sp. GD17]|jgi:O-antigen/teichoic acid export membrane protein|uniref:lipopolysaccharide biosynthesis protein n=1 Tax=Bacteroides sp. GD17 TaxID=3139826 RepID=UPI00313BADE8